MGNTSVKENQNTDQVNKPKQRRTKTVGRGADHGNHPVIVARLQSNKPTPNAKYSKGFDHQLSYFGSDTRGQKYPLTTQQTSSKRDFEEAAASIPDQRTSAVLVQHRPPSPVILQSPLANSVPRKFSPSFLATTVHPDQTPAVVPNVILEEVNTIAEPQCRSPQFANEPGKRWYNHSYETKLE